MTHSKRDANEAELVRYWRAAGCIWIPQPRENGFDGILVSPHTGIHLVEVKNGQAMWWGLTDPEIRLSKDLERIGSVLNIVTCMEEAEDLVIVRIRPKKGKKK